ncbi:hypothetical protein Bbelb_113740 [Branchiostoma belcheri]|nr:hypothetical protein Bbelb_113740 [Branchiostoma belcheri]
MASGVASQIKEEFLVCQICFEDYLNPKVLPCQHTFCKTCLENMVAKMGKLTCPNCRLACQLPRSGVEGLPTSFFVNKLRGIIGNAGTHCRREDESVTTSSYSLDFRGESVPVACGREWHSLPTANRAHDVVFAGDTAGTAAQQTGATPAGGQPAQNTRSRQAHVPGTSSSGKNPPFKILATGMWANVGHPCVVSTASVRNPTDLGARRHAVELKVHPDRVLPILSWLKEQDITTAQDLHDNWEDVQNMVDMTNAMKQHITEALAEISPARREELREDCGYNEEGYPVANSCRPCPNGTYSSNGGQKHCQACKTCLSGYKQECSSKQPSVCLCADDEELAPGGTTCQKICCRCLPNPNPSDVIGECVYRHPTTPQYRCKKYSWSAGETCKQLPQPTTPTVHVSTVAPTGETNGTTGKTDAPTPSSTPPATPDQPPSAHTSGEASTSEGMSTVTPVPVPGPVAKEAQGENFKEDADATDEEDGGGSIIIDGGDDTQETGGTEETGETADSNDETMPKGDDTQETGGTEETGETADSNDETMPKGDDTQETGGTEETGETADSNDETMPKGDDRQETGGTEETGETADSDDETVSKEPGQEDTMEFKETIEEFPNDEKGRNTAPPGGGANQQQPQGGGGQPPPYTGHHGQNGAPAQGPQQVPVVNITGGHFYGNFIIQGNNSQYFEASTAGQQQPPNNGRGNPAPRQGDGRRQHPAQQGIGGGNGAGPNNGAAPWNQGGNGNGRVGNRRRQDIQVNILPNRATPGQDVRFSCVLPPDIDPSTCEFRWRKQDQVHCVAQVQNWNRAVQHCDAGVYTCEVTTPGGEVLDGQAELVIIEDNDEDSSIKEVYKPSDGDSGTVSNESSETSSDKKPGPEDTMEFVETIEGFPNDEKGRNAAPPGGGANQQQPQGGRGQPPPYPGQNGAPAQGPQQEVNSSLLTMEEEILHQDREMEGYNSQLNKALVEVTGQAPTVLLDKGTREGMSFDRLASWLMRFPVRSFKSLVQVLRGYPLGRTPSAFPCSNGRVGNRRRQNIRVNILPNRATPGQDVRFSCVLPPDIDPSTCEFRWRKQDQVDCVAQVQNWNRAVQHCDAGVYTCEVTTPGGEVLDGQAELVIIEDNDAGGVALPSPSRRPRDDEHTPRKKPRTAGPGTSGAQGFSASRGQIQGMDGQGAQNRGRGDRNTDDGTAPRQADGRRQHPPPQYIDRQGGSDRAGPYNAAREENQLQEAATVAQNDRLAHPHGNGNGRVGNRRCPDIHGHPNPVTPAVGGVTLHLPGPSRRPRDNNNNQPTRERLRTAGPGTSGAQGFSPGQIQVPDFIQEKPLEAILNEEDLFSDLRIKLEQADRHYRNIGSHFGLTHEELGFIEFTELGGKDSPLRAILQKVTKTDESKTVGELLQYCDEKLKRRDVVKTVVDYFVKKENQEIDMKVKEGVVADNLQQTEECCKKDNVDSEMKEVGSQSAAIDVPEEILSGSESSVAQEKLGTCDFNTEAIELVEIPS